MTLLDLEIMLFSADAAFVPALLKALVNPLPILVPIEVAVFTIPFKPFATRLEVSPAILATLLNPFFMG